MEEIYAAYIRDAKNRKIRHLHSVLGTVYLFSDETTEEEVPQSEVIYNGFLMEQNDLKNRYENGLITVSDSEVFKVETPKEIINQGGGINTTILDTATSSEIQPKFEQLQDVYVVENQGGEITAITALKKVYYNPYTAEVVVVTDAGTTESVTAIIKTPKNEVIGITTAVTKYLLIYTEEFKQKYRELYQTTGGVIKNDFSTHPTTQY